MQRDQSKYFFFIAFIISLSIHLLGPYYPVFLYQSGLSVGFIGLMKAVSLFSSGIFAFIAGTISDEYGRLRGGRLGLTVTALGIFFILFFSHNLRILTVAFLLLGIGSPLLNSFEAWIVDEYKKAGKLEDTKKLFSNARILTSIAAILAGFIGLLLSQYSLGFLS
ncbi:hypothetical protein CM19_00825 [Candidatus Acidianus copahuensis]|uniref:Major facilitator superfamily (MFS) profile domain-containing protein n=1 Tax=Candidatus Acidianus copahuensis TaxID=1160895 RepID=A0A031LUV2_9CREN|nr:MFS transporter [Candidatus Acidianus copahuensis]EZQ11545.1 hypothetical protein CM19_00825 [Candidatus Acidianus copahuensis]